MGKRRSEHVVSDTARAQSFEDTIFHQILDTPQRRDAEVQHTIRGAIAAPAVAAPVVADVVSQAEAPAQGVLHRTREGAPLSPPSAPEPKNPVEAENQKFL